MRGVNTRSMAVWYAVPPSLEEKFWERAIVDSM